MHQLPMLAGIKGLFHGFSTRADGNQRYGFGEPAWKVSEHRDIFLRRVSTAPFPFRVAVEMAALRSGFEEAIVIVNARDAGRGMTSKSSAVPCEALVTGTPNLTLFLTVGDCPPVVLFDQRKRVLALVHAGRESTVRRIPEKALLVMMREFGTDPADVIVGMGPGFRSHFLKWLPTGISDDPLWNIHISPNGHGTFLMNLFGYNRDRLVAAGVPEENIDECPFDTYAHADLFFSHRRSAETGEKEGRHACAVGML